MKHTLALLFLFLISSDGWSQTSNDDIENRLEIFLDAPVKSFTHGNTVQWNCVDEKLTGKCIKYHNDQWYYFTAHDAPRQYINISGQDCRDIWGVQLVVIEGVPCKTETYNIITCVSLATQDDIYTVLENLEPGKQYLLNIDGYLHDYCSFDIELSLTPKGLPANGKIQIEASSPVSNDTLNYYWQTPDSLLASINSYQLYKRMAGAKKFTLVKEFPARQDAYGSPKQEYYYSEVILPDNNPWTYKLVATKSDISYTVDNFSASASWRSRLNVRFKITPEIPFNEEGKLTVSLVDYLTGTELEKRDINFIPAEYLPFSFNVTKYVEAGVSRFQIRMKNIDTEEVKYVNYEYEKGSGVKKMK